MVSSTQQDGIQCQGPTPPAAFSVPNGNKKLEVGRTQTYICLLLVTSGAR